MFRIGVNQSPLPQGVMWQKGYNRAIVVCATPYVRAISDWLSSA